MYSHRVLAPIKELVEETKAVLRRYSLNTVCEESLCPNMGECFSSRRATFMILGKVCTRACKYCNTSTGRPLPPDPSEPVRLLHAIKALKIEYAVLTSVDRDDLPDYGSGHFRKCIDFIKDRTEVKVEALTPDFMGSERALERIIKSRVDLLAHNIETVERLFPVVRPKGDYRRSLKVLRYYNENSQVPVKSGLMVGLGESMDEIKKTVEDLRSVGVSILVVGQYLAPTVKHHPVVKVYAQEEFLMIEEFALSLGFKKVLSKPLARSSYHAEELSS